MKIYLPKTPDMSGSFKPQDVINAHIVQKTENGYIVNICGDEVFAHCLLDLNIGDFLKLKLVESSASQIVFKVVQYEAKGESEEVVSRPLMPFNMPQTIETNAALKLLAKLNLPIKKERLTLIMDLLRHVVNNNDSQESSLALERELSSQSQNLLFHKALSNYINSDSISFEDQVLEQLQEFVALKDETSALNKTTIHNRTKADIIKDYLALKSLNFIHNEGGNNNICFYTVPVPIYHNIYLKVSHNFSSRDNTQAHHICLSFIINTKNLGAVLIDLVYANGKITASSTFEDKKALDAAKRVLSMNKSASSLIKSIKLKVGKVSVDDFFFGEIKEQPMPTGINLMV
ncbi:conserved protein of unknown function [Tepidanaerobacter acetatoxydans Re1]|uniref:Uncharacterized protein n=1 Tax=Tepidanaerobacter acetatoxydans (strain DSM 21804 / JCM 16047 / Re1) TaxID=1209989 RepID=F4LVC7_TEPAE|nr:hypothetical protein [Tepidanaerobacter acetatoxydans]AEE90702.1 hypothetical protein TepRe1_0505 [Tepidanaerobacter acetatoxydans Re1]CCP25241.1 conserved protein of unknown function [Tepidanaerobacter acetatoxydans Re1]